MEIDNASLKKHVLTFSEEELKYINNIEKLIFKKEVICNHDKKLDYFESTSYTSVKIYVGSTSQLYELGRISVVPGCCGLAILNTMGALGLKYEESEFKLHCTNLLLMIARKMGYSRLQYISKYDSPLLKEVKEYGEKMLGFTNSRTDSKLTIYVINLIENEKIDICIRDTNERFREQQITNKPKANRKSKISRHVPYDILRNSVCNRQTEYHQHFRGGIRNRRQMSRRSR